MGKGGNEEHHHHGHGNEKARKHENQHREKNGEKKHSKQQHNHHVEEQHSGGKAAQHCTVDQACTPEVLELLGKTTGLSDKTAWANIWLLISKGEQDNDKLSGAFEVEGDKGSLFGYASALSYDRKQRGVTLGIVGWTTADGGKDDGDAEELFRQFKEAGGEDLLDACKGCTKDQGKAQSLITKIRALGSDPKFVHAQWQNLCSGEGYIKKTIEGWKKAGVEKPSPLAIATVLDCALNQGFDGKDGGVTNLEKLAVHGKEDETLEKYNKWRRGVAGTNEYNEPRQNGENRADMFEILRKAKDFDLKDEKAIKKALAWEMK